MRKLSFTGSLLSFLTTLLYSIYIGFGSFFIVVLMTDISDEVPIILVITLSALLVSFLISAILSLITMIKSTNSEKLAKKSALAIVTVVFNLISIGTLIWLIVSTFDKLDANTIINILAGVLLLISTIMILVDYIKLKKSNV